MRGVLKLAQPVLGTLRTEPLWANAGSLPD